MEGLFGGPTEADGAPIAGTKLPAGGGKSRKPGKAEWDEETVGELVCGLMGIPAVMGTMQDGYDRPWWVKSARDVQPISRPLTRMLNRMNPALIKAAEKYVDPVFLLAGYAAVVGPAVREELAHREAVAYGLYEQQPQRPAPQPGGSNGARPAYAVDTAADAAAAHGADGPAADPNLFPSRARLDRVNLSRPDGDGLGKPPRTG